MSQYFSSLDLFGGKQSLNISSQVRIRSEIDSVKKKLGETDKKVVALEAAIARFVESIW